jgi:hypothetical protein
MGWQLMSWDQAKTVKGFFPLEAMARLIDEPFSRLGAVKTVADQIGEKISLDYHVHWYEILIVIIWTAIFVYLSYALLKKRDL